MSQTSYQQEMDVAELGQVAEAFNPKDRRSGKNDTLPIPFGRFLTQGTDDDQVDLPNAAGDLAHGARLGVSLRSDTIVQDPDNSGDARYPAKEAVAYMKKGRMWVKTETNVSPVDDVFVRVTTAGGGDDLGQFRNDADGGDAVQVTEGLRFMTTGTAGGLVLLDVDL